MILSRRRNLQPLDVTQASHAGLWLDKYIRGQLRQNESPARDVPAPAHKLVEEVASISAPQAYEVSFRTWRAALQSVGAELREATVRGRMAIGLGDESVLETSVALHHTYGVPYIPGSALKGLAGAYARQHLNQELWGLQTTSYQTLFGTTDQAGYVTFFDALYVPGSGHGGKALHADIMAIHHPSYYQQGNDPPADWDSPSLVPFLTATGSYLIALAGPGQWVAATFDLLALALDEVGIGAKTSSGYGRMAFKAHSNAQTAGASGRPDTAGQPNREQVAIDMFLQQLNSVTAGRAAAEIPAIVDRWRKLDVTPASKSEIAKAILAKVRSVGREPASLDKVWYREVKAAAES